MKILKEQENKLLERKQYEIEIDFQGKTISGKDLKKQLATELKTKEELMVIKNIKQLYGLSKAIALVNVYQDEKKLKQIENIKKKPKKNAKETKAKEQKTK